MSEPFSKLLRGTILPSLRSLKPYRLAISLCLFISFVMAGCSSLHVDISPAVDWNHVREIGFQSPLQDPWQLTQSIRSELKDMGFQVEETPANPDLLFSYFTQESPDLTEEGEVFLRLKSLHIQFIDPATKALVTAVDYFYPEIPNSSPPEMGVKEVFSGLQQQIHKEISSQSAVPARKPSQTAPTGSVVVDPPTQIEKSQTERLRSNVAPTTIEPEEKPTNNDPSELSKTVAPPQETATTVLKKPDSKSLQAIQQIHSPWVPRFKSWGFENWEQDPMDDY